MKTKAIHKKLTDMESIVVTRTGLFYHTPVEALCEAMDRAEALFDLKDGICCAVPEWEPGTCSIRLKLGNSGAVYQGGKWEYAFTFQAWCVKTTPVEERAREAVMEAVDAVISEHRWMNEHPDEECGTPLQLELDKWEEAQEELRELLKDEK